VALVHAFPGFIDEFCRRKLMSSKNTTFLYFQDVQQWISSLSDHLFFDCNVSGWSVNAWYKIEEASTYKEDTIEYNSGLIPVTCLTGTAQLLGLHGSIYMQYIGWCQHYLPPWFLALNSIICFGLLSNFKFRFKLLKLQIQISSQLTSHQVECEDTDEQSDV
jgi:hypothetical protein